MRHPYPINLANPGNGTDPQLHLAINVSAAKVPARLVECADSRKSGCRTADACRLTDRTPPHTTHTRRRSRFDFVARPMTSAHHDRPPPRRWPVGQFAAALGSRRRGLGVRRRQPGTASRRDRWPGSSLGCSRPGEAGSGDGEQGAVELAVATAGQLVPGGVAACWRVRVLRRRARRTRRRWGSAARRGFRRGSWRRSAARLRRWLARACEGGGPAAR
jgi:hypothetical protein